MAMCVGGDKKKEKQFTINTHRLMPADVKIVNDVLALATKDGKYVVPPQLFMQFHWCTLNSHNPQVLAKAATYRKI